MINNPNSPRQDTANNTNFSPSPPNSPRHTLWLWIIAAVAVVLVISTVSIFAFTRQSTNPSSQTETQATATATNAPSITPTTTSDSTGGSTGSSSGGVTGSSGGSAIPVSQARATVSLYYEDINAKDYQSAYNRWGRGYRNETSYQTFAQGFATTQRDSLQQGTATQRADGTVKVPVTVTATVPSSGSSTINTYRGDYIVGLETGQPRLLTANLQLTTSNKDSVKRAISLIVQYYDDINAKDYSDAYAIWGSAYHKSTSSYQFAKGFDNTQSVSIHITFEGVTILGDGTVRVPLTITSVETSGSGTTSRTYQGSYIVGMENEVWHLLSATIR